MQSPAQNAIAHEPLLTVSNVSKTYGRYKAIQNVSFTLTGFKPCIIVGPNGCGKSTLLKIIAGLLTPEEGTVTFASEISTRRIGYTSHEPGLYAAMTVEENLVFFKQIVGEIQTIQTILDAWNITSLAHRYVGELSKGQLARVALARAWMGYPGLLVLDEPTAFLDSASITLFIQKIRELQNTPLLIASHDTERLRELDATIFSMGAQ